MNLLQNNIDIYKPKEPILSEKEINSLQWQKGEWTDGAGFLQYQNCGQQKCQSIYDRLTGWARDCVTTYALQKHLISMQEILLDLIVTLKVNLMEKHIDHIYSCFDGDQNQTFQFSV